MAANENMEVVYCVISRQKVLLIFMSWPSEKQQPETVLSPKW